MAKYQISEKGVAELKKLAADMSSLNNDIDDNGRKLTAVIGGLSDGLGIYEDEIMDLVSSVNATKEKGRESVEVLTEKINKLADDVEELVNAGL
mgnify:FL=1